MVRKRGSNPLTLANRTKETGNLGKISNKRASDMQSSFFEWGIVLKPQTAVIGYMFGEF